MHLIQVVFQVIYNTMTFAYWRMHVYCKMISEYFVRKSSSGMFVGISYNIILPKIFRKYIGMFNLVLCWYLFFNSQSTC